MNEERKDKWLPALPAPAADTVKAETPGKETEALPQEAEEKPAPEETDSASEPAAQDPPAVQDHGDGKDEEAGKDVAAGHESLWRRPWISRTFLVLALVAITAALILGLSLDRMKGELARQQETISGLRQDLRQRERTITEQSRQIEDMKEELQLLQNGPNTLLKKVESAFAGRNWQKVIDLADELHELYPGNANDKAAARLKKQAKAALEAQEKAASDKKKKSKDQTS